MATSRRALAILSPLAMLAVFCESGCGGSVAADSGPADGGPAGGDAAGADAAAESCTTGPCPITLASGYYPITIAVDATSVYWGNKGCTNGFPGDRSVMKVPVGGGTVTTLASNQDPVVLTVDATNVYWTDAFGCSTGDPGDVAEGSGTVMKMALDGGTPTTLVPWGPFAPQGIAVDATSVYWADFQGPAAVLTVPVGGGTPTSLAPFPQVWGLGTACDAVAVDATSLYWVTGSAVSSLPLDGGTPITLWQGQPVIDAFALDAENVYWGTSDGAVMMVPKSGGTASTLASGLGAIWSMAVDSKNVYWGTGEGLMRMPVGGGTPTMLASGLPVAIALDATSVYWAGSGPLCQRSCPVPARLGLRQWRASTQGASEVQP